MNIRVLGTNEAQVRELAGKLRDYLKTDPIISQNIINLDDSEGRPGGSCATISWLRELPSMISLQSRLPCWPLQRSMAAWLVPCVWKTRRSISN